MSYRSPKKRLHRSFLYLDDNIVLNSLSSFEAGAVDEIVSKAVVAREGGLSGKVGLSIPPVNASVDGGRKGTSTMEEEIVRKRTRFSVFETWFNRLGEEKGLGEFDDWGEAALSEVIEGDTVIVRARISLVPIISLIRLYLWYAEKAGETGNVFSQKGPDLQSTRQGAKTLRMLLAGGNFNYVLAEPLGSPGPTVGMTLNDEWVIQPLSSLGGFYTIVGQVQRILNEGEYMPVLRFFPEGEMTEMERQVVHDTLLGLKTPAADFEIDVHEEDGEIHGPAVWIEPVAIFK